MNRYVYLLLDDEVPFYVGKGTYATQYTNQYQRPVEHIRESSLPVNQQSNVLKCATIQRIISRGEEVKVKIVGDNLSEFDAIKQETQLIKQYKRIYEGGTLTNLISEQKMIAHERRNKPVYQFSTIGELLNQYISIKEAYENTGVKSGIIVSCCKGRYKTGGGFVWSYIDKFPGYIPLNTWNKIPVDCYSLEGKFVATYESGLAAEKATGICVSVINKCRRREKDAYTAGNFVWVSRGEPFRIPTPKHGGRPKRRVCQYNIAGEKIACFESYTEAQKFTKILASGIHQCCNGKKRIAGGHFWALENETPIIRDAKTTGGFKSKT